MCRFIIQPLDSKLNFTPKLCLNLGQLKFGDVIEEDTIMMRLLFIAYMVAGNFIVLNLFISVINEGLAYINENPEAAEFDEELANYISVSAIHQLPADWS